LLDERICSLDTHFELFTEGKGQKEKKTDRH